MQNYPASDPATTLVFGIDAKPPLGVAILVGVQHVSAMVVGTITPPLILAGILKFPAAETAYLISIALLCSAIGALLQCRQRGPVGSGLLSVTGTSFAFLQPLTQAGQTGGLALMFGLSCVTAPLVIVLAPFIARLRSVFTPVVSGTVVLLIGASLIPSAYYALATPLRPDAPPWLGLAVGLTVVIAIVLAQATGRPWLRIAGAAIGVAVGCALCGLLGALHAPAPDGSGAWITLPRLLPHGFAFRWELAAPFAFIYVVSLLEAMGDMTATAQLSGLKTSGRVHWRRLSGGVLADGLLSTTSALFGGFPSATYAQNNGVIQITGVASRRIGYVMAAILALLGLFPPVGRWVTAMPPPVLGGLALLMFGLVAVSGVRLLVNAGLGQREGVIVALALGIGLGLPTQPGLVASFPPFLRSLFESGISAGGLTALIMNLAWPAKSAAAIGEDESEEEEESAALASSAEL
ncbi:MAG TPA: solute carrier family 23 protein [Opitutus sp.]|nr:solute carrier family 23 protein [Opitutus sp.]